MTSFGGVATDQRSSPLRSCRARLIHLVFSFSWNVKLSFEALASTVAPPQLPVYEASLFLLFAALVETARVLCFLPQALLGSFGLTLSSALGTELESRGLSRAGSLFRAQNIPLQTSPETARTQETEFRFRFQQILRAAYLHTYRVRLSRPRFRILRSNESKQELCWDRRSEADRALFSNYLLCFQLEPASRCRLPACPPTSPFSKPSPPTRLSSRVTSTRASSDVTKRRSSPSGCRRRARPRWLNLSTRV